MVGRDCTERPVEIRWPALSNMKLNLSNTEIAFRAKSEPELRRSALLFKTLEHPTLVRVGTFFMGIALKLHLPVEWILKRTFFAQFCGGESIEASMDTIEKLAHFGIGTILDYSVEGADTEASFDATMDELLRGIALAENNPWLPFCVFKMTGIARFTLMEKLAAKVELSEAERQEWARAHSRLVRLCEGAYERRVRLFIDAEETWIQDVIDRVARDMMLRFNRERPILYNTLQMYRHDRIDYLKHAIEDAQKENYFLGLKLVRGAYMEKERLRAQELGYPSPIQPDKASTDRAYDEALSISVANLNRLAFCAGTHNEQSTMLLTELMRKAGIASKDPSIYFSQLLGMSDHISYNLADAGYNVAKYVPYGPIRAAFPYLTRRAEENTSIQGQTGRELSLIQQELQRRRKTRNS